MYAIKLPKLQFEHFSYSLKLRKKKREKKNSKCGHKLEDMLAVNVTV